MISSDAFLPRDPAWGRFEALRSCERVERNVGGKKGRGAIMMGAWNRVCVRACMGRTLHYHGPVRRQIGTYNHRDYLVLGIDRGFA